MNIQVFEPKYRDMQPETEDLLANGKHLRNGMVVLIESPYLRADAGIRIVDDRHELDRAKVYNRWAEVSDVDIDLENDNVSFVATYEDGTKRKRVEQVDVAWFVKKDSLSTPLENMEDPNRVEYAETDANATMTMLQSSTLVLSESQFEQLSEALQEILPGACFNLKGNVGTLEVEIEPDDPLESSFGKIQPSRFGLSGRQK